MFSNFFSSQQNGHIAELCEPPTSAQNYLYNTFFCRVGKWGEEGGSIMLQCYMLHVTLREIHLGIV